MSGSHLVEVNELPADKLCTYIEHKFYQSIKTILENLTVYVEELIDDSSAQEKEELEDILLNKLKIEVEQLIRNDSLIIFPLIRNEAAVMPCKGRKLPLEMIHSKNKKIMYLFEKIRHMANGYIYKPTWSQQFKIFCGELHDLEQMVLQTIYLKENLLLPKVEKLFNQPCAKTCKHG
jgi:iron-sulfur cluster repair protein YtfE (RIC family)